MKQRGLFAWAVVILALLSGCQNNGTDQNSAQVRAVNAVIDAEPLDVLVDDNAKATALALGVASSYSQIDSGTRNVKLRSSTTSSVILEKSVSFASGSNTTLVAYGRRNTPAVVGLSDDTSDPSSGKFKVRLMGLSPEASSVDLYMTTSDIATVPGNLVGIGYSAASDYVEASAGSYQFAITASGTKEVLFRSSPQSYTAGTKLTLGVFPTTGGRLVNVLQMTPGSGGSATVLQNSQARLKVFNAIADSAGLNYVIDSAPLLSNVPFSANSSYVSTAIGAHSLGLEASNVPGTSIASVAQQLDSAKDYTVLAVNSIASPGVVVLVDDNTLPASGYAKVRFVNALAGSSGADVLVNFAAQTSGLAYRSASAYAQFPVGTDYTITFATPNGISVLATLTSVAVDAGGVYTAYLYGQAGSAQARLVRDR